MRMTRLIKCMVAAALVAGGVPTAAGATKAPVELTGERLAGACAGRDGWSDPAPPAHILGNTWYIGTCGIAAILVTTEGGHVVIDSGPADAAPALLANIRKLGFDPRDVKWILSSHEHHDHVGGLAELQRETGARIAALASASHVLESGKMSSDDPQAGHLEAFEPVRVSRTLAHGDSVIVSGLAFTVHETPAHSPGSASWTWQACDAAFTCHMIAYADSTTTISAEGYRFAKHPDRIAGVRVGLSRIADLPCDVLVTPHPSASNLFARLSGKAALVDSKACRAYAETAREKFNARLAEEAKEHSR
jgi:metallo-beta-lactamase class B